jgi:hypothetical protein
VVRQKAKKTDASQVMPEVHRYNGHFVVVGRTIPPEQFCPS